MSAINWIMYELSYRISKPRWDDGQVPPQVAQLASTIGNTGRVLDLGCGTGTHAVYLAQQGLTVTGVDLSNTAIQRARVKASQARVTPEFIVHDVTQLDFLRGPFDIALDVGCLHALSASQQHLYASALTHLMRTGSTLLVWGMDPQSMGMGLTPKKVTQIFTPGFKLQRTETAQLHGRSSKWYWLKRQ